MADIFISYKREERAVADRLGGSLRQRGWTVWWDPELRAGERFDDVIEAAIEACRCMVVLWSARSVKSAYVKDEAALALEHGKLVPTVIATGLALPLRFKFLHTIDLSAWAASPDADLPGALVTDIQRMLAKPSTAAEAVTVPTPLGEPSSPIQFDRSWTSTPQPSASAPSVAAPSVAAPSVAAPSVAAPAPALREQRRGERSDARVESLKQQVANLGSLFNRRPGGAGGSPTGNHSKTQEHITRCTACHTCFRVSRDQLIVSGGWVRCGRCQEVFNAAENLVAPEAGGTLSSPPKES